MFSLKPIKTDDVPDRFEQIIMQQLFFLMLATRLQTPPKSINPWRRRRARP
jgi:hypothetical protein